MQIRTRYDTASVPERDRVAYWRDAVCDSYVRLGCETERRGNFRGLIEISRLPVLSISHVAGLAHRVDRRPRDIRSASESYFLLSLQTQNSARVSQFGRTARLRPGDMALYVSSEPYHLQLSDDFSQTVVQVPAEKLRARLPHAEMLTAQRLDGQSGLGRLVRENILAFADHTGDENPTLQALVQDTLIDLIATGLAAQAQTQVELSSPQQQVLLRAKSFIQSAMTDPELDRHRVAAAVGMSVRRLNEIFASEDTSLAAYIRSLRLQRVAEDLRDPRYAGLSISEIAFRTGFSNMQNFSSAFRTRFGASPRAFRQSGPDA